jgi:2-polyprenyl-6-methoxyphenol hydroxylase-like FAD-dependent oxidoreductase
MAGLFAARVLSDFFEKVTIVDRDSFPESTDHRRGVPQGRHAHALLASGFQISEELFPGLKQEMLSAGGLEADPGGNGRWFLEGGCLIKSPIGYSGAMVSRPLLESTIRHKVAATENISMIPHRKVSGLIADNGRVVGLATDGGDLRADLVVDASGRGSQAPKWLESLGFSKPAEEQVKVDLAYTTRLFRRRPTDLDGDKFAVIPPTPEGKRGGVMLAQEGDRWIVTLFGHFGQNAPVEMPGYVDFARSLPAPYIYETIRDAEPLGDACTFRFPASSRRFYEKLGRFPEGFLVFGDAICSFNPIYGQGMSVAALESNALREELGKGQTGMALRFFKRAAKVIETGGPRSVAANLINWYIAKLHRSAHCDPVTAMAFVRVAQLLDEPSSIMTPRVAWRVLCGNIGQLADTPVFRRLAKRNVSPEQAL